MEVDWNFVKKETKEIINYMKFVAFATKNQEVKFYELNLKKFDELTNIELYNLLKERTLVFVVEQNCPYPEVDGKDPFSYHLLKKIMEKLLHI